MIWTSFHFKQTERHSWSERFDATLVPFFFKNIEITRPAFSQVCVDSGRKRGTNHGIIALSVVHLLLTKQNIKRHSWCVIYLNPKIITEMYMIIKYKLCSIKFINQK